MPTLRGEGLLGTTSLRVSCPSEPYTYYTQSYSGQGVTRIVRFPDPYGLRRSRRVARGRGMLR